MERRTQVLVFAIVGLLVASVGGQSFKRFGFLYTSGVRTYQSSCQSVLVPAGSSAMQVVLFGGSGGRNKLGSQSRGGLGGGISAIVPVVNGTNYFVCVGGKGSDGSSGGSVGYAGWPGGGYAQSGGGGGGFTSLQTSSDSTNYVSRIVVAAGGGGGGYQGYNGANGGGLVGGNAAGAYSQVSNSMAWCCTVGATGGTQLAGGLGGGTSPSYAGKGSDGGYGTGGMSASSEGGGGGGGYWGGGGGSKAGGAGGSSNAKDGTVLLWNFAGVTYTVYNFGAADVGGMGNATITFLSSYVFPNPTQYPIMAPTTMPTRFPTPYAPSQKPTAEPSPMPTAPSPVPTASPTSAVLPASYYPASNPSYASGFTLIANNLAGVVSLPAAYTVSFDLFPTSSDGDGSILLLKAWDATDRGQGGGRLPELTSNTNGHALQISYNGAKDGR